ncbi:aldolase/citrate lyase family protein [Microvirga sp. 0TCS3.31]
MLAWRRRWLTRFGRWTTSIAVAGEADRNVLCFAMIETAEAFRNVEDIVSTPGLGGGYIGPSDLTLALTEKRYPSGFVREEPEMVEAIRHIRESRSATNHEDCFNEIGTELK